MRIVADTNTVVSALLWRGSPHRLVAAIEDHTYPTDSDHPVNGNEGRQKRRLLLTTIVDLRNL